MAKTITKTELNASPSSSKRKTNPTVTASAATKNHLTKALSGPSQAFDPYHIIISPLSTEKSIRQIEYENKLVFVVNPHANKQDVKQAVEELFKVKVVKVNLHNAIQGQKRAYVKLSPQHLASDVSADLGLI